MTKLTEMLAESLKNLSRTFNIEPTTFMQQLADTEKSWSALKNYTNQKVDNLLSGKFSEQIDGLVDMIYSHELAHGEKNLLDEFYGIFKELPKTISNLSCSIKDEDNVLRDLFVAYHFGRFFMAIAEKYPSGKHGVSKEAMLAINLHYNAAMKIDSIISENDLSKNYQRSARLYFYAAEAKIQLAKDLARSGYVCEALIWSESGKKDYHSLICLIEDEEIAIDLLGMKPTLIKEVLLKKIEGLYALNLECSAGRDFGILPRIEKIVDRYESPV